jgi:hypothetical protein
MISAHTSILRGRKGVSLWLCMRIVINAMFDESCTRNTALFHSGESHFLHACQQIIHGLSPKRQRFIDQRPKHPPSTCTCSRGDRQIIDLFNPYHARARAGPLDRSVFPKLQLLIRGKTDAIQPTAYITSPPFCYTSTSTYPHITRPSADPRADVGGVSLPNQDPCICINPHPRPHRAIHLLHVSPKQNNAQAAPEIRHIHSRSAAFGHPQNQHRLLALPAIHHHRRNQPQGIATSPERPHHARDSRLQWLPGRRRYGQCAGRHVRHRALYRQCKGKAWAIRRCRAGPGVRGKGQE